MQPTTSSTCPPPQKKDNGTATCFLISFADISTQSGEKKNASAQAGGLPRKVFGSGVGRGRSDSERPPDGARLLSLSRSSTREELEFLARAAPVMLSELVLAGESEAFLPDDDGLGASLQEDDSISHVHTLSWEGPERVKGPASGLEVTGVCWNSDGDVVAASYGVRDGGGWRGPSLGAVVLWNVASLSPGAGGDPRQPMLVAAHDSQLTCVVAHPEDPGLFGAGSSDGEVVLVESTAGDLRGVAGSRMDGYGHYEPVTSVKWAYSPSEHAWHLVSLSGDGRIIYWTPTNSLKYPLRGSQLNNKIASNPQNYDHVGGNALGVSDNFGFLIVGSEGGLVLRTSESISASRDPSKLLRGKDMRWSPNAMQALLRVPETERQQLIKNVEKYAKQRKLRGVDLATLYNAKPPIHLLYHANDLFPYKEHAGPVNAISFNPFQPNLFLTCSDDGEIRFYSVLNNDPVHTIYSVPGSHTSETEPEPYRSVPILDAQFSPHRSTVFCCICEDGCVHLYNLVRSLECPIVSFFPNPIASDTPGQAIKNPRGRYILFNNKQKHYVAVGGDDGLVNIWKLGSGFYTPQSEDLRVLKNLSPI